MLTHCNAGALACVGYGTALGVIRAAAEAGKRPRVWVDETRPVLQGARLTAWELDRLGIAATLVADVMAGSLMASGDVDVVVVGADRVAANGDVANKIGTYSLAVLAAHHGVPFYVAAPTSTVDLATPTGAGHPGRGALPRRGPPDGRRPAGAGGLLGAQPGLRRDPGRPRDRHRDRTGRRPSAVRTRACGVSSRPPPTACRCVPSPGRSGDRLAGRRPLAATGS